MNEHNHPNLVLFLHKTGINSNHPNWDDSSHSFLEVTTYHPFLDDNLAFSF